MAVSIFVGLDEFCVAGLRCRGAVEGAVSALLSGQTSNHLHFNDKDFQDLG